MGRVEYSVCTSVHTVQVYRLCTGVQFDQLTAHACTQLVSDCRGGWMLLDRLEN